VDACRGEGSGEGTCLLSSYGCPGWHPRKIFEDICAVMCNLVHSWQPVQHNIYNSVFNLDFGRSV